MTFARFEQSERQDLARIKELQQDDPAVLNRDLPPHPLDVTSDTWIALVLCADGWSLEEIEEYLVARKEKDQGARKEKILTARKERRRQELTTNQRRALAAAYDGRGSQ